MNASRRKRIQDLFAAARLLGPEERSAFLKLECGDDQGLFEEVISAFEIDSRPGPEAKTDTLSTLRDDQDPSQEVVSAFEIDSQPGPEADTATLSTLRDYQVVANRFRIVRHIGKGGMGDVYEAEDLTLGGRVALKTIRPEIASTPEIIDRFKREILLGKRVTHPNVCRIHDLGFDTSGADLALLFLTMEFLKGETLSSRIKRGPIPEIEALPLIEDMLDGLAAAHNANVIHRDFKSGNVMLVSSTDRIRSVVTDFGLARAFREDSERMTAPDSNHETIVGTVAYMAPEQIEGREVTPAADIYALGVVIYEMLTGKRPFTGDSSLSIAMKQIHEPPRPPREVAPHLTAKWDTIILGCLQKAPEDRFPSAAAVRAALAAEGAAPGSAPLVQRRKMPVPLGAVLAVVVLIALALAGFYGLKVWRRLHTSVAGTRDAPVRHIVIADIQNHTGQAVLDHTIRELLASSLEQSSVLKVFPAADLADALRRMEKPETSDLSQQVAIDLCQREGLDAAIVGSATRVGDEYLIILTALDPRGEIITTAREGAHSLDEFIRSTERAAKDLRQSLGESARSITSTVPLDRVTSISLQAVQYFSLGKLQLYDGNPREASNLFQRAVETDSSFAMAHCYAGVVYEYLGDIAAARKELSQAVSLSERVAEPEKLKILGDYSFAFGDFGRALGYYQSLSQVRPEMAAAHVNLGQAYLGQFDYGRALAETETAIHLTRGVSPEDNAIEILFLSGQTEEAMDRAGKVLRSHPDDPRSLYFIGRCHLVRGEKEAARQVFQHLCATGSGDQSAGYTALADMALAQDQIDGARRELQNAMVVEEKAHNPYKVVLQKLGLAAIDRLSGREPEPIALETLADDDRLLMLAAELCQAERYSSRLKSIIAVLERHRATHETPMLQSFLSIVNSDLAMLEKKPREALESARRATQFENSAFAIDHLARTYAACDMPKEAISEFEKVLARSNERMDGYDGPAYHRIREVHQKLAELYRKTGDLKQAEMHEALASQ